MQRYAMVCSLIMEQNQQFDPQDVNATKGLSCLSYIGLLFLVPMLVNKDSAYTKFHVNQGIVLFILEVICSITMGILGWIPFIGWAISSGLGIITVVFAIMGIVNAVQGQAKRLPIIGNIELYK